MTRTNAFSAALALLTILTSQVAFAQQQQENPPLKDNFSALELTLSGVALLSIGTLMINVDTPSPGMGPPAKSSTDWRFTHWSAPEPDPDKWLGGVPDVAGYLAPVGTVGFYGGATIWASLSDRSPLDNRKHELVAFSQSVTWTFLTVNALKHLVGRQRPYSVRQDVDKASFNVAATEENLSFPSGHSAAAAVTTTFIALDFGDYLVREVIHDSHPISQALMGRVLPMMAAGGLTSIVMYSRVKDQRHWLSDTLTGALIGSSFATLFYSMHFDAQGQPRTSYRPTSRSQPNKLRLSSSQTIIKASMVW